MLQIHAITSILAASTLNVAGIGVLALIAMPILAVVLGVAALRRIDHSEGQLRGRGLAIGAIVMGVLCLMAVPFLLAVLLVMPHQSSYSISNGAVAQPVPNNDLLLDVDTVAPINPPATTSINDDLNLDDNKKAPVPAPVTVPAVNPPPATTSIKKSGPLAVPNPAPKSAAKKAEFEF